MHHSQDHVTASLELHLFFARIMKEHSFFLKAAFLPPNENLAREAECFLRKFENLLSRAITLSRNIVHPRILDSGELFTPFTCCAEEQTQRLTGIRIDRSLTARIKRLQARDLPMDLTFSRQLATQVHRLNREALGLVDSLISFKERLLNQVGDCHLFTLNYPLLIEHILREARLYRCYLLWLEDDKTCDCQELRNTALFWNRIMMEHALFIRGLLDPSEEALIEAADGFAQDFRILLNASAAANDRILCKHGENPLALTEKFRDFKKAGVEGIEACKIRSVILPLLADHVLREANHYIRLLEE